MYLYDYIYLNADMSMIIIYLWLSLINCMITWEIKYVHTRVYLLSIMAIPYRMSTKCPYL